MEQYNEPKVRKRGNGLAYFAVGLMGAIIGGFIMAAVAPLYIYGKILPYPDIEHNVPGQQIIIERWQRKLCLLL